MIRLRAMLAFIAADPGLIPQALVLPNVVYASIRLAGVARTQQWLRNWALRTGGSKDPLAVIDAALRAQQGVRRYFGLGGSCLIRSYTLWAMLGCRGVNSQIRIGMRKRGAATEGHAWVEYDNRPINEKESVVQTYTVFPESIAFDEWRSRQWAPETSPESFH